MGPRMEQSAKNSTEHAPGRIRRLTAPAREPRNSFPTPSGNATGIGRHSKGAGSRAGFENRFPERQPAVPEEGSGLP
ncbi:hypothetical protein SUDANB37_02468 [Streptomyces sp. enrichment culture]